MIAICEHCHVGIFDLSNFNIVTDMVKVPMGVGTVPVQHVFCNQCYHKHLRGELPKTF